MELYCRGYILDVLEVDFTCGCEQYEVHIIRYYVMVFSSVFMMAIYLVNIHCT